MSISIIVPVYNASRALKKCVDSLRNQTFSDISIILVDDGSTDGSGKVCDDFAAEDPRIKVIHKKNGGVISARNAAITALPEGGFTTFCDADDYMPRDALEKLYILAVEFNADVATGILQRFTGPLKFKPMVMPAYVTRRVYQENEIHSELMQSYYGIGNFHGYMPTKLYRNSILKESVQFKCPVHFFQEDVAYNMQIIFLCKRIAVMPDVVYYYRMGGGTSRFMPTFWHDCISLYHFKLEQIEMHGLPESFRYTTAVELKNELATWLEMYYLRHKNTQSIEEIRKEIQRCCEDPTVVDAVNYPKADTSGIPGFRDLVIQNNIDGIYALLRKQEKKTRIKRMIKKIILGL